MILLLLIIGCLIYLFFTYLYSREDYIFLRKNVTLDNMFDYAFTSFLVALFTSRMGFILLHPKTIYFNPLVFLMFPYFPGLSLTAGLLFAIIFLFIRTSRNKHPSLRILNISALSFLITNAIINIPLVIVVSLMKRHFNPLDLINIFYIITFVSLNQAFLNNKLKVVSEP